MAEPKPRKWRAHLTREEAATIARADAVKEDWRRLKHQRALIVARASARARRAEPNHTPAFWHRSAPTTPPDKPRSPSPRTRRARTMGNLTPTMRAVLLVVRDDDAYWTSDIAHDARMTTKAAHSYLKRLERADLVERVVRGGMSGLGGPTSWRRTPAGRTALAQQNDGGRG